MKKKIKKHLKLYSRRLQKLNNKKNNIWSYSTNLMGPMNHWYETNKIPFKILLTKATKYNSKGRKKVYKQYSCGRIDCYCNNEDNQNYSHYGEEIGLPIMTSDSFSPFSNWLDSFTSRKLLSFKEIQIIYETETTNKLEIFTHKDIKNEI